MTFTALVTVLENFKYSLGILVEGMAGIFIFMGVFYALIIILNIVFKQKKEQLKKPLCSSFAFCWLYR